MSYVPNDRKYSKTHFWVKIVNDEAIVGKTDYGQGLLGTVTAVNITTVDQTLHKDAVFGTITANETTNLQIPVGGGVDSRNDLLTSTPGLVNSNPYDNGWMIKVKNYDGDEVDELLNNEEYDKVINE